MQMTITGHHIDLSQALREYVGTKVALRKRAIQDGILLQDNNAAGGF